MAVRRSDGELAAARRLESELGLRQGQSDERVTAAAAAVQDGRVNEIAPRNRNRHVSGIFGVAMRRVQERVVLPCLEPAKACTLASGAHSSHTV